jgi:hypothetical protein
MEWSFYFLIHMVGVKGKDFAHSGPGRVSSKTSLNSSLMVSVKYLFLHYILQSKILKWSKKAFILNSLKI